MDRSVYDHTLKQHKTTKKEIKIMENNLVHAAALNRSYQWRGERKGWTPVWQSEEAAKMG